MAISFQYNKTSLQDLEKNLKVRVRALPTIKNKESALRIEVKRSKTEMEELGKNIERAIADLEQSLALLCEFDPTILSVDDVQMSVKKIAGVRVPVLDKISYKIKDFSIFNAPKWFIDGFEQLKNFIEMSLEMEFIAEKLQLLEHARKKTTQKVNLFEKVQIPGYQEAILKIKRFMEDEENLSKSSQKIVKTRRAAEALATDCESNSYTEAL